MAFMPILGDWTNKTGLQGMAAPTPFSFPTVQRPPTPTIPMPSTIPQPLAAKTTTSPWLDPFGVATGGETPYVIGSDYNAYDPSGNLFGNAGPIDPVTGKPRYWTDPNTGSIIATIDANGNITSLMNPGTAGQINWFGEEVPTTLDIPTDLASTSTSTSSSYSGLSPEFQQQLMSLIKTLTPAAGQYIDLLGQAGTPGAFMASFNPVMEGTVDKIVDDLAKRGLIDSGQKENLLQEAAKAVPQAWLSNLLNIAGQYGEAAKLPFLGIGEGTSTTSTGTSAAQTPLSWDLMVQLLLGT